ncbi:MAG: hypothetical protein EAZ32_08295 [Cytophagia bacterium]|nr:MAG: hypothetical protein EAZ32_08295 [Cytophagia bacterium]
MVCAFSFILPSGFDKSVLQFLGLLHRELTNKLRTYLLMNNRKTRSKTTAKNYYYFGGGDHADIALLL